jgi:hypothetical protein
VAHLSEASKRIEKVLDAQYIYNQSAGGGMGFPYYLFGESTQSRPSEDWNTSK